MAKATILLALQRNLERKLLGCVLKHEGFGVREAATAKEVIELPKASSPELIILDSDFWQSAKLNALSTLKHHPGTASIPVILFGRPRSTDDIDQ